MNDLEKMRETLELVITQAREIGTKKEKAADAMALLEEAGNSRSMLARDDYDSRRWKDEVLDTREQMVNSGSVIVNAVNPLPGETIGAPALVAANGDTNSKPADPPVVMQPVADVKPVTEREQEIKPEEKKADTTIVAQNAVAQNSQPVTVPSAPPTQPKTEEPKTETPVQILRPRVADNGEPMEVGALLAYATNQPPPVYPQTAKNLRTTGIVRVEVMVNEEGEVEEVQKTSGPSMLQSAAKDAIRKWRFKPFTRDGQAVKARGFVSFNFAL
jgi:TonB family protein